MEEARTTFTVPKRSVYALLTLTIWLLFSGWQWQYLVWPGLQEIFGDPRLYQRLSLADAARLFWVPFIGYGLISGIILLAVTVVKPLKLIHSTDADGLVDTLVLCFISGLVVGLLAAAIVVLLEMKLTVFPILALNLFAFLTLCFGLIWGIIEEFK